MMKLVRLALSLLVFTLLLSGSASAKPGTLDPSFGKGGRLTLVRPAGFNTTDAAQAPDGSLLVATEGSIVRVLPNGRLDPGFGSGGSAPILAPDGLSFRLTELAVDPAGRPVVFGSGIGPITDPGYPGNVGPYAQPLHSTSAVVMRYTAAGALDASFAEGGAFVDHFGLTPGYPSETLAATIATGTLDREGRPVFAVAGAEQIFCERSQFTRPARLLVRLDRSGAPDPSFGGGDGAAPVVSEMDAEAISIDTSGAVTLAGSTPYRCNPQAVVLERLDASGEPDAGFGGSGVRSYPKQQTAIAMASNRDDEIALLTEHDRRRAILRLDPDGKPVRGFGRGGLRGLGGKGQRSRTNGILLDRRGRILTFGGGWGDESSGSWMAIERILPSGRVDRGFGAQGEVQTQWGRFDVWSESALFWGKRLLILGSGARTESVAPPRSLPALALARYELGG